MSLVGIVYATLVDKSLFKYAFSAQQMAVGAACVALVFITLGLHHQKISLALESQAEEQSRREDAGNTPGTALRLATERPLDSKLPPRQLLSIY